MEPIGRREFLAGSTMAAAAAHAQKAAAESSRKNVLLMIADDLGCFLPMYGDRQAVMPNIEKLASMGAYFTNAYCTSPSCSASRSVLLSGRYNHNTGHYGHAHAEHHFSYLPNIQPFPPLLKKAGYATGYIAKLHVEPEAKFEWDMAKPIGSRDVAQMSQLAEKFIQDAGDKPWYLHCGFHDPHRDGGGTGFANKQWPQVQRLRLDPAKIKVPAFLPDNAATRADLVEYYEAANRFDQGVGMMLKVLEASGQADHTLVIVMSDHGAPFPSAKTNTYDAGLHVPLIVRRPGMKAQGIANHAMTNWADIMPSILDWTGVKGPDYPLDGRSWLPILEEPHAENWDRVYFSHTFHEVIDYYPMRGVRTRRYKYIHNLMPGLTFPNATDLWASPTWQSIRKEGRTALVGKRPVLKFLKRDAEELYDLEADPNEVVNLAGSQEHQQVLTELRKDTLAFRERTNDVWMKNPVPSGEQGDSAFA